MSGHTRLRVLVVMDELRTIKPGMDSTVAIISETFDRDHTVDVCTGEQLALVDGGPIAQVRRVVAIGHDELPELGKNTSTSPLRGYDAVLMRKNPPFDGEYFVQTLILDRARDDCVLVNDPRGLRDANEKLAILDFPGLIPRTLVTRSIAELHGFLAICDGDVVVKPLNDYGGRGVVRVLADDQNRDALLELATCDGTRLTMAQNYVEGAELGDKRILLLAGKPIGTYLRRGPPGMLRCNVRAGGTVEACELTANDRAICDAVGERLRARGLHFVGIDVVGGCLTEINVTSPCGIRELMRVTGERVECTIVDWLEDIVAARRTPARDPPPR